MLIRVRKIEKGGDGFTTATARQVENQVDLQNLRGQVIECLVPGESTPRGAYRVHDVSFYGGLGDGYGKPNEVGFVLIPVGG